MSLCVQLESTTPALLQLRVACSSAPFIGDFSEPQYPPKTPFWATFLTPKLGVQGLKGVSDQSSYEGILAGIWGKMEIACTPARISAGMKTVVDTSEGRLDRCCGKVVRSSPVASWGWAT